MTRMKKPPSWKVAAFIIICALQIYFINISVKSLPLSTGACIAASVILVMLFFGWKLTNLAAISVFTIIIFLSEGIVTLFVFLFSKSLRLMVYSESYITLSCVVLSRCIQCFLTYVFIVKFNPRNEKSLILPRYILLGLIAFSLMVLCMLAFYMWALGNDSIPDWSLIIYMLCTVTYITVSLIIMRITVRSMRELDERKLIDLQGALSLEVHRSLEQLREYEHNYSKHLQTILCLAHNGLSTDVDKYCRELVREFELAHISIIENMPALSAAIQRLKPLAEKKQISLETDLPGMIKTKASELHLCVILSNLLENAVEACDKVDGERRISLLIKNEAPNDGLYIRVENTFDVSSGRPHFRRDLPATTKEDRELHGYGLRSVKRIVSMYGGKLDISYTDDGLFKVEISL